LTLPGQLEVLGHPPETSWAAALPLNPALATWRERAAAGRLAVTGWSARAARWLGGAAYARRFLRAWRAARRRPGPTEVDAARCQEHCVRARLSAGLQYPLLWSPEV
jgi:hypothetical protein